MLPLVSVKDSGQYGTYLWKKQALCVSVEPHIVTLWLYSAQGLYTRVSLWMSPIVVKWKGDKIQTALELDIKNKYK